MRVIIFLGLVLTSTVMGGLYGIVHDEFTFSISPEFYTKVRFEQLNIDSSSPRLGAAIVGFHNTWLYSMIIGAILSLTGWIHAKNKNFIKYTLESFLISMSTSFAFGLMGYVISVFFPEQDISNFKLPPSITDAAKFTAVQVIHNFSYMGGIIGMFLGLAWQFQKRKKDNLIFGRSSDVV